MGSLKKPDIDSYPKNLEFAVFSSAAIKQLSVVKVVTGLTFDTLGHQLPGGLYDRLMGVCGRSMDPCDTCLNVQACPGHVGHIELNALVFNPFFVKLIQRIWNIFCVHCFKIQMKEHVLELITLQLKLIDAGYVIEAQELEIFKSNAFWHNGENEEEINEDSGLMHAQLMKMRKLLSEAKRNDEPKLQKTRTLIDIRSAVVSAALQRLGRSACINCGKVLRTARILHHRLVYYIGKAELQENESHSAQVSGQNKLIFAEECRNILRQIYINYTEFVELVFPILKSASNLNDPTSIFFMDTILVTPPKARPINVLRDQIIEHPQTTIYRNIIQNNSVLRIIIRSMKQENSTMSEEIDQAYKTAKGSTPQEKYFHAWQVLQSSVDMLLDDTNTPRNATASPGLKQLLEKKEGLIRKHMMGKRVNYAARTVITPDPNINVDEVGVPDVFARKLSYPVPVTSWNVTELRKMVINGPDVHPGANYIQDAKGNTTIIPADNAMKRESMAKLLFNYPENGIKTVHRHLLNGDPLLLNRQPSLHRPSIMAHKARILMGEKTFRLHYSNCKAYNADFDGDEMNAHYPQCEVARSEAYNLVNVANNYLVPKDGTPLGGLIQDHVISGVKLSIRGRFFNREDYQQLVWQGLSTSQGDIELLPPAIIKPIELWSGKQVLSTLIINLIPKGYERINLCSHAKISSKQWNTTMPRRPSCGQLLGPNEMSESEVLIQRGELLAGVLDKQHYGATTFGLIHCIYELYGGDVSTRLLTALTKLFTVFLQHEGFTLGVQDILVTTAADSERRKIIRDCREIGNSVTAAALDLESTPPLNLLADKVEEAYIRNPKFRAILDRNYKLALDNYTNDINKTCLPLGLISKFPANNLQLMVLSGAKGSLVNTMQISCLLGQIELEGKRPPLMISNKSLPSFASFETSPKSGGFIDGRFMTGIQPQEFFFHCMAGREGLIDTAVKTSRSGYLQRCLIKHLEGLSVNYDLTVRDSDSSVIQFLYGEDGLDVLKAKFFNTEFGLNFLMQNSGVILRPCELDIIKDDETLNKTTRHAKKIQSWLKKYKQLRCNTRKTLPSAFTNFSAELRNEVVIANPYQLNTNTGRRYIDESIIKLWAKADESSKELYRKRYKRCPDPTTSIFKQDINYGAVSETIENLVKNYILKKNNRRECIADIMYVKNLNALAAPGEPVGLLAAQSIGEPSTQMTLNTFHFAGRGEMNVTLGIPRLREILMLASLNIKTPSMDIPIKVGQEKHAEKLRTKLNRVTLADVLHYVDIKMNLISSAERVYQYQIHFQFLPREAYQDDFCVRPKRVLKFMSKEFLKRFLGAIGRANSGKAFGVDFDAKKKTAASGENDDEDVAGENSNTGDVQTEDKQKKTRVADKDSDSSDDECAIEGDDATNIKLKFRKQDEAEYDDPDDVEEIVDVNDEDDEEADLQSGDLENNADENEIFDSNIVKNSLVSDYVYDKEHHLWCKLTFKQKTKYRKLNISSIIRDLARKCTLHEVTSIKRAIIYKGENNMQMLKTDGVSIIEMFAHNKLLDLNRLYTNDIHAVAKTYGVEAAARVIVSEVTNVFKVYGITVDPRHLSLIADYMTFNGRFEPLSRKGMEHSSSPLQQISFESCLQFLKNATNSGCIDELNSPSSRLMVGLPVKNGTGAFTLLTQIN